MEKNSTLKLKVFTGEEKVEFNEKKMNSSLPPQALINNILNYSKALLIRKTKNQGFIEVVLN